MYIKNLLFSTLLTLIYLPTSYANGEFIGNGGEFMSAQFISIGHEIHKKWSDGKFNEIDDLKSLTADDFLKALNNTRIDTVEGPIYDNQNRTVDARYIKDGTKDVIEIDREIWLEYLGKTEDIFVLTFHEYLRVLGVDDDQYKVSEQIRKVFSNGSNTPDACFDIQNGTLREYLCKGVTQNVVIPNGVTKIASRAFASHTGRSIESVRIPDSVVFISHAAFINNPSLTSVQIPEDTELSFDVFDGGTEVEFLGTTVIDHCYVINRSGMLKEFLSANDNCRYLNSLTLPEEVSMIGGGVFKGLNLTSVILPKNVTSIGEGAFSENSLSSITIPPSVNKVKKFAFKNNDLALLELPNSITEISESSFYGNSLTFVKLPDSLISIKEDAFAHSKLPGSNNLKISLQITFPNSIKHIGNRAFEKTKLKPNLKLPTSLITIGSEAFKNTKIGTIKFSDSITSIGFGAFSKNRLKGHIELPKLLTIIKSHAFSSNQHITGITFPSKLAIIEYKAFFRTALKSFDFPNSLVEIGREAFSTDDGPFNRFDTAPINLPESLVFIGARAFKGQSIVNLSIPKSLTSIEAEVFSYNKIKSLTLHDSITEIGDSAFFNNELRGVSFPKLLTKIGKSAFEKNALKSVELPNSIKTIGNSAFKNNAIAYLTLPNSLETIEEFLFHNNMLEQVTIPGSVKEIKTAAFSGNKVSNIEFNHGLRVIDQGAFRMNALTSLNLPESVQLIKRGAFSKNRIELVTLYRQTELQTDWLDGFDEQKLIFLN